MKAQLILVLVALAIKHTNAEIFSAIIELEKLADVEKLIVEELAVLVNETNSDYLKK